MASSEKVIRDYLSRVDAGEGMWNENANTGWTPSGLLHTVASEEVKKDYLKRMRDAGHGKVVEWHKQGMVHLHDLGMGHMVGYCVGHSLRDLASRGLKSPTVSAGPSGHLRSLVNHIVGYIGSCSNEWAGAQALSDIDVYMGAYLYADFLWFLGVTNDWDSAMALTAHEAKQCMQELIWPLNLSTRYGSQTPFSNVTLAITCPPDLKDEVAMVGNEPLVDKHTGIVGEDGEVKEVTVTYGMLEKWQGAVADAFMDVMLEGDAEGRVFTFPVLSINCTEELFDHWLFDKVCALTAKYGTPFFQNFINGKSGGKKLDPSDVRSMCCRLSIDESMIRKHTGGIFGAGDNTGSIMVGTMSLPWMALVAKKRVDEANGLLLVEDAITDVVDDTMQGLRQMMLWKREAVEQGLDCAFLPMTRDALKRKFATFYTTFGFLGLWECVQVLTGDERAFLTEEGMLLAEGILSRMTENALRFSEEDGKLFNVEAVPGESAGYKLALKAIKHWGSPATPYRGTIAKPYFTNGTQVPVEMQGDLSTVLDTQSRLQPIPSGGTVVHLYTGEKMEPEDVKAVIKTMCATPIPFFSISLIYSHCPICGHKHGAHEFCEHTEEEVRAAGMEHLIGN